VRKQIWIIDDSAESRLLARAILAPDYDVVELASGDEVAPALDRRIPDLMLIDITMPGQSGLDVLAHVRSDPRLADIPTVAYTARSSRPERQGLEAFGFDAVITKPVVDERDLLRPVAELLSRGPRPRDE
jgi:two-component system alkaline phosphatase synthesis response regulator PhoP